MDILYVGHLDGTAVDRANALRRLGHRVEHINLRDLLPRTPWIDRITWRLGGHLLTPWLLRILPKILGGKRYTLCYVDAGELVTPRVIRLFRRYTAGKVINYNIDDPLGPREPTRSIAYRQSVPYYDLIVVVREENIAEAVKLGAKETMRVFRSADEIVHAPRTISAADAERWSSEVLFLGTWFPERGPFLLALVKRGVPLTIRGANWHKAAEWPQLKPYFKGGQIEGDEYAMAIQCARVNLGLLSKGNRDLHTTRSLEIPALGGLFCAERTSEHVKMYREDEEALFWDDADECAARCLQILGDEPRRRRIAAAGHARSLANRYYNEVIMSSILERVSVDADAVRSSVS